MRVVLAAAAAQDLDDIAAWIAQDHPGRAIAFIKELRDACRGLGRPPLRFQLVPRYERHGIRRRVHGRYLIFYRIRASQVEVLRILDGARDFEPLIFPETRE